MKTKEEHLAEIKRLEELLQQEKDTFYNLTKDNSVNYFNQTFASKYFLRDMIVGDNRQIELLHVNKVGEATEFSDNYRVEMDVINLVVEEFNFGINIYKRGRTLNFLSDSTSEYFKQDLIKYKETTQYLYDYFASRLKIIKDTEIRDLLTATDTNINKN